MKRELWQSKPRKNWQLNLAVARTLLHSRPILSAVMLLLVATACEDQSGNKPTSPLTPGASVARSGTPADPHAATLAPRFSLVPSPTSNAGPAVAVLAYCTDMTGGVGAENVAQALMADGRFGSVAVIDADASLPSARDLAGSYAAVIAMTDNRCGEPIPQNIADAAANALAGFAQGGGGVVLTTFGFADQANGGIGFGAAIFARGLSPLQPVNRENAEAGGIDLDGASTAGSCHALLDGVTGPLSSVYANEVSLSEGAQSCVSYSNGRTFLAINATGNIVGLNSFPASQPDIAQPGYARLVSNSLFAVSHVNATVQVIPAGAAATVTLTADGAPVAGIDIPEGTFGENVTLSVHFVSVEATAPCHAYLLGQIGRCIQITALTADGDKAINHQPMTAGLCLSEEFGPRELFKFEDPHGTPVALQQTMVPFLDCTGFQVGSAARIGGLKGLAMGVARSVSRWLSPTPLYAAHGGFGGKILAEEGLSFFTWASPLQVSNAGLAVNVRNSGKDAYALNGTFQLQPAPADPFPTEIGFSPSTQAVTVAFGANSYTIPAGSFRYSPLLRRWLFAAQSSTGITAMSVEPITGRFIIAATVPTAGGLPIDKPFSLRIGNHTQGLLLECGARGTCVPQEPPE
jgi:hypothetical protein